MQNRLKKFRQILKSEKLDSFIVTKAINIFYLCGFRGVSPTEREAILVFNPKAVLIAPRLYQIEVRKLASKELKVVIAKERNELWEMAEKIAKGKIGFEENDLKFAEYRHFLKRSFNKTLVGYPDLVEKMRAIKTAGEIAKIEKAQIISQKAFEKLLPHIKIGQTEEEIAEILEKIIKSFGGHGPAFESIVAAGENAGLPHHKTGKRKVAKGEVLLLDFGAKYQNYHGDLSRTVFVGRAKDAHRNIYNHVQKAQKKALARIRHGSSMSEIFEAANSYFRKHNLDKYFLHGLGHGVGLEIHELPYLRPKVDEVLGQNMVFSVEPGLYFPWGGVRIEDLLVIKSGRAKILGEIQEGIPKI